ILAEMRPEPPLGAAPQRPELVHREHVPAEPDALAAVEDGPAARHEDEERDEQRDGKGENEEEQRERDVERAEEHVTRTNRRIERELSVPANERVLEAARLRHRSIVKN